MDTDYGLPYEPGQAPQSVDLVDQPAPVDSVLSAQAPMAQTPPLPANSVEVATPMVRGPVTRIAPTAPLTPQQIARRKAAATELFWKNLAAKTASLPMDQTEQAVAAALRFQGQRQYQRDLDAGMNPGEALARSAPLIFSRPSQGSIGQSASFIRETGPTANVMNAGGVLYRVGPGGASPLTQAKPATTKTDPFALAEYRENLKKIDDLEQQLADTNLDDNKRLDVTAHQMRLKVANDKLRASGMVGGTPTPIPSAPVARPIARPAARPAAAAKPSGKRVRVRASNGKTGSIPAEQLEQAKAQGYTLIQ